MFRNQKQMLKKVVESGNNSRVENVRHTCQCCGGIKSEVVSGKNSREENKGMRLQ